MLGEIKIDINEIEVMARTAAELTRQGIRFTVTSGGQYWIVKTEGH